MASYTGHKLDISILRKDFEFKVVNLVNYMKRSPNDSLFSVINTSKSRLKDTNTIPMTEAEFDTKKEADAQAAKSAEIAIATAEGDTPINIITRGDTAYNNSLTATGPYNPAMATVGGLDGEGKLSDIPGVDTISANVVGLDFSSIPNGSVVSASEIITRIKAVMRSCSYVYKVEVNDTWVGGNYSYVVKRTTPAVAGSVIDSDVDLKASDNNIVTGFNFSAEDINGFINACQDIWRDRCLNMVTPISENVAFCHANHSSHGNHGSRGRR